jgi:hypothetical protein
LLTVAGVGSTSRGQWLPAGVSLVVAGIGDTAGARRFLEEEHMLRPETPEAAGGAAEVAEDVAGDVAGETPDPGETRAQDAADDARAGEASDAESTGSPWADDRTTHLDPGRVGSDERQTPAERSEGEPDE